MTDHVPAKPANSARIILTLNYPESRMDNVLLKACREQDENANLKIISRGALKALFTAGKIMIKGYSKTIDEQQAEIEALKAKLNKYHLKEDLDRNLNLIYGNEFIK